MKCRYTQYRDAMLGSQFLQLAQGVWVLSDIAKHDSKARSVALKAFEKLFSFCAMGDSLDGRKPRCPAAHRAARLRRSQAGRPERPGGAPG